MHRFENKVAVITGGARGIGRAIATRLASEGAKIVLIDIKADILNKAERALRAEKVETLSYSLDITKPEEFNRAIASVIKSWKQIDILVSSAGITGKTGVKTHEIGIDDFKHVMDINVTGMINGIQAVLPHMLKANYGRIVNIASISGKEGNAGMLAYSTSKAAVIGLSKVIGKEYANTGITCNAIAPAVVQTDMVASLPKEQIKYMTDKIPMERTGTMEEIASMVAFIASEESSFSTGFTFDASGGRATY